jgi:hypothetical protein
MQDVTERTALRKSDTNPPAPVSPIGETAKSNEHPRLDALVRTYLKGRRAERLTGERHARYWSHSSWDRLPRDRQRRIDERFERETQKAIQAQGRAERALIRYVHDAVGVEYHPDRPFRSIALREGEYLVVSHWSTVDDGPHLAIVPGCRAIYQAPGEAQQSTDLTTDKAGVGLAIEACIAEKLDYDRAVFEHTAAVADAGKSGPRKAADLVQFTGNINDACDSLAAAEDDLARRVLACHGLADANTLDFRTATVAARGYLAFVIQDPQKRSIPLPGIVRVADVLDLDETLGGAR